MKREYLFQLWKVARVNKDGDIDNDDVQKIMDKCVSQIFVFSFGNDTWKQVLQYCGSFIYHTLILNFFFL